MGFSKEWQERYEQQTHLSIWPWSDLVSYVMRYAKPDRKDFKVLELGCGAGANIPFFLNLGVEYYSVEGSQYIVNQLLEKYPLLKGNIIAGDFTKYLPFNMQFDLIVDRGSLTCNSTESIKNTLEQVEGKLKQGGFFIGIDWFSTEHSEYERGKVSEDSFTKNGFLDGPFANTGNVHFSSKEHLRDLFKGYEFVKLENKVTRDALADKDYRLATWNFAVKKVGR
ncbi:class I SAM-dependent methyltransferase [Metabacillus fastidiosus]|uniref:class I SAM-dependent methyltransferase n=1 Tax=Metabacillus fastidiosus TaxID=1458 RepID=UPI003D2804C4